MIDPNLLRNHTQEVEASLAKRGFKLNTNWLLDTEQKRKTLQNDTQELQQKRNLLSKQIGQAKAQGLPTDEIMAQVGQISEQLKSQSSLLETIQKELQQYALTLPNLVHKDVPSGKTDQDNLEIKKVGNIPQFDFEPKDHVTLGHMCGGMDFEAAAKLSGARFTVLKGPLARLHRALIQWMINVHIDEHGYQECYVPYLVKQDCYYGTGQLPKFADDFFQVKGEYDLNLISTAEVPLANLYRDTIIPFDQLPIKLVTHTPCFRSEAGSYGQDTKGMIRQHQFEKVEMVHIVPASESATAHEQITGHATHLLDLLKIPYRVVLLCTGDLGFSATKTYDIEAWLPGQQQYREISSCSNCLDFQARRMKARTKNPHTGQSEYVHTLNGSGLPAGRTLVAILENNQDQQGNIHIPSVLVPYMNGQTMIENKS